MIAEYYVGEDGWTPSPISGIMDEIMTSCHAPLELRAQRLFLDKSEQSGHECGLCKVTWVHNHYGVSDVQIANICLSCMRCTIHNNVLQRLDLYAHSMRN